MTGATTNRLGETIINKWGDEAKIIEYNKFADITIKFKEYNEIVKTNYGNFKKGTVKSKFTKSIFNVGYIGVGQYKVWNENSQTIEYIYWMSMLARCYYKLNLNSHPTYLDCSVCDEWLNFQVFAEWFNDNYYQVGNETMCLDKDILHKGNKIYSPENCIIVPERINILFTKNDAKRGDCPIGVDFQKSTTKYRSRCSVYKNGKKESIYLGYYDNTLQAYEKYKEFKEKYIKEVAEEYKDKIPKELYNALYRYEVEITD